MVSSDHQVRCMGRGCHGIESREAWWSTRSLPSACHCRASDGGGWMDGCRFAIAGTENGIIMGWGRGGHPSEMAQGAMWPVQGYH